MRTVAGVLENALSQLFDEAVKVTGAGRTDSGVHATGQVISLSTGARFPFERLGLALRGLLAPDCSVRDVTVVDADFSARFCAEERRYVYVILNRREPAALIARYAHHVSSPLDLELMQAAARPMIGEHDFCAFAAARPGEPTVRRLHRLRVERYGELVRIEVAADGFLYRMVRIIAGTLIECGLERTTPTEIEGILGGRDRLAGPVAPPQGLYLAGVRYPDGYDSFAEPPITLRAPSNGLTHPTPFP